MFQAVGLILTNQGPLFEHSIGRLLQNLFMTSTPADHVPPTFGLANESLNQIGLTNVIAPGAMV